MMPRMKEKYLEIAKHMAKDLPSQNQMAVPKIEKIVLNVGFGSLVGQDKEIENIITELSAIAGQHATKTTAKKAVSGFKLREGAVVGAKVTLRGNSMYEFLDRLISVAIPRTKDFRGLKNKAFAGGSYSIGIKEHTVFPEISVKGVSPRPLQVTIVTNSKRSDLVKELLDRLGMPLVKEKVKNG